VAIEAAVLPLMPVPAALPAYFSAWIIASIARGLSANLKHPAALGAKIETLTNQLILLSNGDPSRTGIEAEINGLAWLTGLNVRAGGEGALTKLAHRVPAHERHADQPQGRRSPRRVAPAPPPWRASLMTAIFHAQFLSSSRRLVIRRRIICRPHDSFADQNCSWTRG